MGFRAKLKAENALIFVPDREKIFNQLDFQMLLPHDHDLKMI